MERLHTWNPTSTRPTPSRPDSTVSACLRAQAAARPRPRQGALRRATPPPPPPLQAYTLGLQHATRRGGFKKESLTPKGAESKCGEPQLGFQVSCEWGEDEGAAAVTMVVLAGCR